MSLLPLSLLWSLLAVLSPPALAQASPPAEDGDEADSDDEEVVLSGDEEMIVVGALEAQRRRQALEQDLRDLGYRAGKKKEGRTVYRPEVAWHPTVIIDDDGYAIIKRSPVRFEPWVEGRTNLRWISCIPPFTIMCVRIGGQVVSSAKLTPKKQAVAEGIDPSLDAWRAVVVSNAMSHRLGEDIPDMLQALWAAPPATDPLLATPAARRAALLEFWVSRACTPEGAQARSVTADFLRYEVQPSADPVTPEELAAVNARRQCGDALTLE